MFRWYSGYGVYVCYVGDMVDFSYQVVECGEFQFGEIEVNLVNRVNIDIVQVNIMQYQ